MTIEEMKQIKKEKGYTYSQIAEFANVPLGTVQKIFGGETQSPRYDTLVALERFFAGGQVGDLLVREESAYMAGSPGKKQGEYTVKDYYAFPDDRRVELIDGVIYDMSAPNFVHQRIAGEIYRQISNFIYGNKGECIPMVAPVDVRLDCDDKTMVQPDVLILCDKSKIKKWGIMGAPDFVLEVLSPSTIRKDCVKKIQKYLDAGVKEYWMLDPVKQKLIIYDFQEDLYPAVYGLDENRAVKLFEEKLVIDMSYIRQFLLEESAL